MLGHTAYCDSFGSVLGETLCSIQISIWASSFDISCHYFSLQTNLPSCFMMIQRKVRRVSSAAARRNRLSTTSSLGTPRSPGIQFQCLFHKQCVQSLGGFHQWRPWTFLIFWPPPPPCHIHDHATYQYSCPLFDYPPQARTLLMEEHTHGIGLWVLLRRFSHFSGSFCHFLIGLQEPTVG